MEISINLAANNAPAAISSLQENIAEGRVFLLSLDINFFAPLTPESNEYSPSITRDLSKAILLAFNALL